jgi:hypothetical protein
LLWLSFGGPERPEDVRPFLENVTSGRGVPPERLDEVEQHYRSFGGVSPITDMTTAGSLIQSPFADSCASCWTMPSRQWLARGTRRRAAANSSAGVTQLKCDGSGPDV